jgi:hypothetical protein
MAFTIEDGTGLATSNAYITAQEFVDHHTDRGVEAASDGTFSDAAVLAGIINATDYVDKRFGRRFRGDRLYSTQALEWPRTDAYTDEDYLIQGIPAPLKKAIAEYALITLQLARNLAPIPAPDFGIQDPATGTVSNDSSGKILEKSEEVGPIKESTKYADGTNQPMTGTGNLTQQIPAYPQADLWLEEILTSYSNRRMSRG